MVLEYMLQNYFVKIIKINGKHKITNTLTAPYYSEEGIDNLEMTPTVLVIIFK